MRGLNKKCCKNYQNKTAPHINFSQQFAHFIQLLLNASISARCNIQIIIPQVYSANNELQISVYHRTFNVLCYALQQIEPINNKN
jgi:hypothetical protein